MIARRSLLSTAFAGALSPAPQAGNPIHAALPALEQQHGGRLGVAILNTAGGPPIAWRGEERFPLCSTYKALAAACVLARIDRDADRLDRRVVYTRASLVPYSPVTEAHAGQQGLTLEELCAAAVTLSDNTAGNLLLDVIGGPSGLTHWLRRLGDRTTRLDRREPVLNDWHPGDLRDTTSPLGILTALREMVVGEALSTASRDRLMGWLVACRTGDKRLRALVPVGWRVGDKTGSGARSATNDIAVLWPPGRRPILVTAFYVASPAPAAQRDAVLADVGRLASTA